MPSPDELLAKSPTPPSTTLTSTGLKVLALLVIQNSSKNLITRFALKDQLPFLYSAAVIGSELTKLSISASYILFIERKSPSSILQFLSDDRKNGLLLLIPASVYNAQQTLEYIALANLDPSVFSVLVQSKLISTAIFSAAILKKHLTQAQVLSLCLLTVGVMLCNMKTSSESDDALNSSSWTGIFATLMIALCSGFASVYTEKVIKAQKGGNAVRQNYSLAYMQVQMASVSLCVIVPYALWKDFGVIVEYGLWHNFNAAACGAVFLSAMGGLTVAAVLKYADAVLKGYATAVSVILTGVCSMYLFGSTLNIFYFLGICNVCVSIVMYSSKSLYKNVV